VCSNAATAAPMTLAAAGMGVDAVAQYNHPCHSVSEDLTQ